MNWLEKIQHKTPEEKKRIIWTVLLLTTLLLVILWIATSNIKKRSQKDSTLINSFKSGINDVKENYQGPNF